MGRRIKRKYKEIVMHLDIMESLNKFDERIDLMIDKTRLFDAELKK